MRSLVLSGVALEGAIDVNSGDSDAKEDSEKVDGKSAVLELTEVGVDGVVHEDQDAKGHGKEELCDALEEHHASDHGPRLEDERREKAGAQDGAEHNHEARASQAEGVERRLELLPIVVVATRHGVQHKRRDGKGLGDESR